MLHFTCNLTSRQHSHVGSCGIKEHYITWLKRDISRFKTHEVKLASGESFAAIIVPHDVLRFDGCETDCRAESAVGSMEACTCRDLNPAVRDARKVIKNADGE